MIQGTKQQIAIAAPTNVNQIQSKTIPIIDDQGNTFHSHKIHFMQLQQKSEHININDSMGLYKILDDVIEKDLATFSTIYP